MFVDIAIWNLAPHLSDRQYRLVIGQLWVHGVGGRPMSVMRQRSSSGLGEQTVDVLTYQLELASATPLSERASPYKKTLDINIYIFKDRVNVEVFF